MPNTFGNTHALIDRIINALQEKNHPNHIFSEGIKNPSAISAVLFLLGLYRHQKQSAPEPSLILNKRSVKVKQPGDLCCPGGSISSPVDFFLSRLLHLPGSPLRRWPHWRQWYKTYRHQTKTLALLFATGLRESVEEMRLNPMEVNFLGPLPPEQLIMFRRVIYPLVCWTPRQRKFFPNWEVEKVVYIPVQNLLNPSNYARYRLDVGKSKKNDARMQIIDYPCFLHENSEEHEVLWGATFRITMAFLDNVFGFKPPAVESLPVIRGSLDENYLTGNG